MRIRIRLTEEMGNRLAGLRPVLRGQVVATILESHGRGVELAELLAMRRELARLGTLINLSLRTSRGVLTDAAAVQKAAAIIAALVKK